MKIGFVQTGSIKDIIIALPAAKWYVERGFDVFWPVDYKYISFFKKISKPFSKSEIVKYFFTDVSKQNTRRL